MNIHLEDSIPFYSPFSCDYNRIFSGSCFGEKSRIEILESARSELDFKMSLPYGSMKQLTFQFLETLNSGCVVYTEEGVIEKKKGVFLQNLWSLLRPTYQVYTFAKYSNIYTWRYISELLSWWRHRCFGKVEVLHLSSYGEYWKELKILSQKQFESEFWL